MITVKKTKCVVCGEEVPYTDVSNPPTTCWRKSCQVNAAHSAGRTTIQGNKPDPERTMTWPPSSNSKN